MAYIATLGIIMVAATEKIGIRSADLVVLIVVVHRTAEASRATCAYFFATGIIMLGVAEEPRTALANLATTLVIMVYSSKKTRAANNLLAHICSSLSYFM